MKKSGRPGVMNAAQVERNAIERFRMTCDLMIGPGHFSKFTKICHQRLLHYRFDAVKMKFTGGKSTADNKLIESIFREHLGRMEFMTIQGLEMPLSLFLREGLVLIFYVETAKDDAHLKELAILFQPYFADNGFIKTPISKLVFLLHRMSIILSDLSTGIFLYSLSELAGYCSKPNQSYVPASYWKPESCIVRFENIGREVIRLSWTGCYGEVENASVVPCSIGLNGNAAAPVYIQKHALQRLRERLGLLPGLIQHEIFELFDGDPLVWHQKGSASLVELKVWETRVGYLYCDLADGIVVIRSFLFLTNDGTPEGKLLSKLTQLQKLDKRYLEIDTLNGFRSFKISEDAELSSLFREAGCEDLLDLAELESFCMDQVKEKDLVMLLKYIMGRG